MTSRREEKEVRRAERMAAEEEAARAEARRRAIGIVLGAALAIAALAAVVLALSSGGGGGKDGGEGQGTTAVKRVPIPAQKTSDLAAAATAAGCQLRSFKPGPNDQQHVTTRVNYKQNPPVFGPHNPVWAHDGSYAGQKAPPTEMLVHPLEHGRVVIWYRPAIGDRRIGQLQTLFEEPFNRQPAGYKEILVQRAEMPFAVAASGWGQQLGCPSFNDRTFDALRAFRATYVDKGPESIPFPE